MKTTALFVGAAALALASCSGNKDQKENAADNNQEAVSEVVAESVSYAGILPAADGAGIAYDLTLEPAAEAGKYFMTQQYNGQDTAIVMTEGTYDLLTNEAVQPSGKYYRLVSISNPGDTLYFALSSDTTITMLTPALQTAPSGLDYVLTIQPN